MYETPMKFHTYTVLIYEIKDLNDQTNFFFKQNQTNFIIYRI